MINGSDDRGREAVITSLSEPVANPRTEEAVSVVVVEETEAANTASVEIETEQTEHDPVQASSPV